MILNLSPHKPYKYISMSYTKFSICDIKISFSSQKSPGYHIPLLNLAIFLEFLDILKFGV